jgi:S1-C subfamily serine protease
VAGQTIQLSRRRVQLSHLPAATAVLVTDVIAGGPADLAGIRPRDIIFSIDGSPVAGVDDMQRLLTRERILRTARVALLRDGTHVTLSLTPAERG